MKRSVKNLIGYTVRGLDGPEGRTRDFLFDEDSWIVRYLDADFGKLFQWRRHLIPTAFLEEPEWNKKLFPVSLKKEHIEACPDLEEQMSVSRAYEKKLRSYYGIDVYWPYLYTAPAGAGIFYPPRPMSVPTKIIDEEDVDTKLRSFSEIEGYAMHASDGKIGHVDDLIVDDDDWQVVYLILDTNNWIPWSKKVVLSVDWLEKISYTNREIEIGFDKEAIKEAPEYDPEHPVEMDYEKALYEYFESVAETHH